MMHFLGRAAVTLFVLAGLTAAGSAQSTAPAPKLDAEALKIPDSARDIDANKLKTDKTKKALPPPSVPSKVDLGKYDLEFKAGQTSDVNPRTGFDSGEKSNLSNSSVGRRPDTALPDYFGLKLSTPTE